MNYDSFVRDRLPPADQLPEFLLRLDYPERLNAAAELLKGGKPGDLAIVNAHGRWTYAELDDFSGRIARLLVEEEGLIPGNRVLLRGPNGYTIVRRLARRAQGRRRGGGDHAAAPPRRNRDGDRPRRRSAMRSSTAASSATSAAR